MDCAAVFASSSHLSSPSPFAANTATQCTTLLPGRLFAQLHGQRSRRSLWHLVAASRRDHGSYSQDDCNDPPSTSSPFSSFSAGRMVDEGMLVLRKRIQDAEMAEVNYHPPKDWSDWERAYYTRYGSDVCGALGVLQSFLLATRPAIAFGTAVVIAMSLPLSAGAVGFAVVQGARAVGAGMGLW